MTKTLNKGDILYYARIMPTIGIYDVCELFIRTVTDTYFVGIDKNENDKKSYLFGFTALDIDVFENRNDALKVVQRAEKNKKTISEETYYEEY